MKAVHLLVLFAGFSAASFCAYAAPVQVKETEITIPTYPLGPEDPNPPFRIINSNNVYPYTMLDSLTDNKKPKTYKAIVLENKYLIATIIPDLGARLYSLYDKPSKREVFYRNNVVKYALIGLRGAWISGGVEFNFPNGHTTDTVSPVSSRIQSNPDGSASIFLGDVDQVSEMYWQVELTLRPETRRLEERVTLYNPTPAPGLYWYWDNAAVRATDDLLCMYPMREVNPDSPTEFWKYPEWKGIDYSRSADIPKPTEIFGVNVYRDYFGVYYPKEDFGVVHVANYRDEAGKKIWTWGAGGDGALWRKLLTDHDGPYDEVQAGVFQNQLNQDWMPPHRVESWNEYWYPVDRMRTGFVDATSQFAVNAGRANGKAQISIESTEALNGVRLTVRFGDKIAKSIDGLSFQPAQTKKFPIPWPVDSTDPIQVTLTGSNGRALLRWNSAAPIDGNRDFVSRAGVHPVEPPSAQEPSIQKMFLKGELEQREGQQDAALSTFEAILEKDPQFIPALRSCALRSYRGAQFKQAAEYIGRAIKEEHTDPQSQYIAGLIYKSSGDLFRAQNALWASIRYGGPKAQAYAQLGEIALLQKGYPQAEQFFRRSVSYNPHDALALSSLAESLRLQKKYHDAGAYSTQAAHEMPLYPPALAEQWLLAATEGKKERAAGEAWTEAGGGRVENYLVAGSWYWSLGDWASSDFILKAAVANLPSKALSPMLYFYLASNARHEGRKQDASAYRSKARTAPCHAVFPNRLSDAAVLRETLASSPGDSVANYLLGTYLFQYGSYAEADQMWSKAQAAGLRFAVLDRDRGVYAWRVQRNLDQAAEEYQKAIRLAPLDHHLYVDLDEIYAQQGVVAKRNQLWATAPANTLGQDTSRARYILLLMEQGQYDKALALLKTHTFHPWELGGNMRDIFVEANIEQGRARLAAGDSRQAQQSFEEALAYPPNLGIGKPEKPQESEQLYWLGSALQAQDKEAEARAAWAKAVEESSPNQLISLYYASLAEDALGRREDAQDHIAQLERDISKANPHASIYYYRGMIETGKNHLSRARSLFQKALQMDPSYWPAEAALAREISSQAVPSTAKN